MKLLVCDSQKILVHNLINNAENYFAFEYFYEKDLSETITANYINNVWEIIETVNVKVTKNQGVNSLYFQEYSLVLFGTIPLSIFIIPDGTDYYDFMVGNTEITIGCAGEYNINYNCTESSTQFASISKKDDNYIIESKDPLTNLYVNRKKVDSKILDVGDVIFVRGIKIIWMKSFVKVFNNTVVKVKGLSGKPIQDITISYDPISESERNAKLYNEDQVFFHSPRLQSSITPLEIRLDPPPEERHSEQMPLILTIGTSSLLAVTSLTSCINTFKQMNNGSVSFTQGLYDFIISLLMILVSIGLPFITNMWQKKQLKKNSKYREERYQDYLNRKKELVDNAIKEQEQILREGSFPLEEIKKRLENKNATVWSREIIDEDFLNLRVGVGDIPAQISIFVPDEHFFLYDDSLRNKTYELANSEKKLKNVPINVSIIKNKIVTFILNDEIKRKYIDSIMLQLMFYYSSMDLKMIIITSDENKEYWNYTKYLPHLWSKKHDIRFFGTNDSDIFQISQYLEVEYENRLKESKNSANDETNISNDKSNLYKNFSEYYLIITDDFKTIKNVPIVNRIINSNSNIGFSLLIFEESIKNIPSRLDKFIDIKSNISGIYSKDLKNNDKSQFKAEFLENVDMFECSKVICNVPIEVLSAQNSIPKSLNFLEMYHVGMINHLNILKRWQDNDPTISLNAPIGFKEGNKIVGLDLHEKVHGPHGLIAGSTGSGKSEFIISYILSMAVNYSPKEVQFILIDYKGGGLAGAFENKVTGVKIPHLIGTITNLDTSEMNRTLVSIQSELKRRQQKFNEVRDMIGEGTIDIYKYQKLYREGKIKDPISHLFVICDEFAELKSQQPDFMDELISTSRIGRSLGVHLILATQKPSGVVNDQIWSNTRFRVCLKVQTTSDSVEMLKRPEAAEIKEAGRFYLQVGTNELFELGQSGWSGAKYIPTDRIKNKINDSIDILNDVGSIVKSVNDEVKANDNINHGEQLPNIVKYLFDLANRENYKFDSLWLPSLPGEIYFSDLVKKYNYSIQRFHLNPVIGEYDRPTKQSQGLLTLNINCKNSIIFGIPNSGKEMVISGLIYMSCLYHSIKEVNFYIIDFGSESLGIYNKFPHVGDFMTSSNMEKLEPYFQMLEKEMRKRKELFVEYSGNYNEYCDRSGNSVPLIVTVLNSYEAFLENTGDISDYLMRLLREGSKYGIVFIISAIATNSIRSTVMDYFSNKLILQSNDPFDYQYTLKAPKGLIPKKYTGRGITVVDEEACEFQTGLIGNIDNINDYIRALASKLQEYYKDEKAKPVRKMPKSISLKSMFKYSKMINKVAIGYTRDDIELFYYDFTRAKSHFIIGDEVTDFITFMGAIIDMLDTIEGIDLNIFDFLNLLNTDGKAKYYNISYEEPFTNILKNNSTRLTVNFIVGLNVCDDIFNQKEKMMFDKIMNNIDLLKNQIFIIFDNTDKLNKIKSHVWFSKLNRTYGIWVGQNVDSQDIFDISKVNDYDLDDKTSDIVYCFDKDKYTVIKGIGEE